MTTERLHPPILPSTEASASDSGWSVPTSIGPLELDCRAFTQKGSARAINEDHFLMCSVAPWRAEGDPAGLFLAVADGLGGELAGEWASRIAIESTARSLRDGTGPGADPREVLQAAALRAHEDILSDEKLRPERAGMATTFTAALVLWPSVTVLHVGDSRCYLLREGRAERLTVDHTYAEELRQYGILTAEAARTSRLRSILWNHLGGTDQAPLPSVTSAELKPGDRLLLATDGVTDPLTDGEVAEVASRPETAGTLCRRLVLAARGKGSRDDATAVIARFGRASGPSLRNS
jgi:serine/threonine protein phosphatase PrpC